MPGLTLMIIRHAEKPGNGGAPFGVTEDGMQDSDELAVKGWQRAGALVHLFAPPGPLTVPGRIVASCANGASSSLRPLHTVGPLAARAELKVEDGWGKGDEAALGAALAKSSGAVLVAWHHEAIPALVNAVLGDATVCPQKWPGHRFHMVWLLSRDGVGSAFGFSQVPQCLLAGDMIDPIPFHHHDD